MQLHSCGHRSYAASPGENCRVTAPRQVFPKDIEMLKRALRPFPVTAASKFMSAWLSAGDIAISQNLCIFQPASPEGTCKLKYSSSALLP
eukprot:2596661-Pleurochrysis_carterae.AAC.1